MELYQRVVVEGNHSYIRRGKQQQQQSPATTTTSSSSSMSFSGALATLVWPAMVALCGDETATTDKSKSAAPPQRRKHEPNDYVNSGPLPLTLSQCSHLAASLLSLQYASGGVREDSLHFVQPDHVPVWNAWCSCLFSNPDDRMADSNSREQQEHCVHCFGVMWACLSMQPWMAWQTLQLQPALSQHVEHLPTCMPERYREYYLRQQQQQQLNSITSEMDKSNPPEASVVHSHSYVAAFIQQVMHIMEESTSSDRNNLTKLKQQRVDPGNGLNSLNDDDEANGSDDVNDEENNDGVGGDYDDEGVEGTDYSANVAEGDAVVAALDNDEIATRTRDLVRSKIHGDSHSIGWGFLHRALELLITLLSSPTNLRSVLLEYLHSIHWTVRCRHALGSAVSPNSRDNSEARMTHMWQLTQQLLKRITIWMHGFPTVVVDQQSMAPIVMTATERRTLYHERASIFQKMCQRHYAEYLSDIVLAGVGLLCASPKTDSHGVRTTSYLRQALGGLSDSDFMNLMHKMRLFDAHGLSGRLDAQKDRSFLLDVLEDYLVVPPDPLEELQSFPLFPTEELLWDFMRIPPSHGCLSQSPVLSLPKLNTRFLSFADYLWRNFELVRLESAYEIRSDLVDVIRRVRPVLRQASLEDGEDQYTELKTVFSGWARMALEMIGQIEIKRVNKALLGERYPSQVLAEFFVDLGPCGDAIRQEWDTLGEFDNLFLVSIDASTMSGCPAPLLRQRNEARNSTAMNSDRRVSDEDDCTFPQRFGVTLVRGCTIVQIRDEAGTVLSDSSSEIKPSGTKRIFRVSLDPTQFSADRLGLTGTDIYNSLNLVVRRQGKVNNFRSVLETIRGLMAGTGSINRVVPVWLQHALLGYGDPSESSFRSPSMLAFAKATAGIANPESYLDYCDTFLDEEHLRSSFSILSKEVTVDGRANVADHVIERRFSYQVRVVETAESRGIVEAKSYPFPEHVCGNSVRFTPRQVAAIRSGLSPGLSLIVGPPGTGI